MNTIVRITVIDLNSGKEYQASFDADAPKSRDEFRSSILIQFNHRRPEDKPALDNKDLIRSITKKYFGSLASDDWSNVEFSFKGYFRQTDSFSIFVTDKANCV